MRPDYPQELLGFCFLHLSFTDLAVLHEFNQIGELEFLLARKFEDLGPLFIGIQELLFWVDLIALLMHLLVISQDTVIEHWLSLIFHTLYQTFDLVVKLSIVSPGFIKCLA